MHSSTRLRVPFFVLACFAFACSDAGGGCDAGCGGCGGTEGGEPYVFEGTFEEHIVPQGAQVHLSQRGLDFLAGNLGSLAADLIGGGAAGASGIPFCVPPTDIALGIGLCDDGRECSPGEPGCLLTIDFACLTCDTSDQCPETATCDGGVCVTDGTDACVPSIDLSPQPGDPSDLLQATIRLALDETLRTTSFLDDCNLNLRTGSGGLPVTANVYFDVGGPPEERVSVRLPGDELSFDIGAVDISLTDGFLCGIGDFLIPLVEGLLADFIQGPINDAIAPLLCTSCDATTTCPAGSSCVDGSCVFDGSDQCVPLALGVETEINIGELLADIAPGSDARLGILAYLSNYADSNGPRTADFDYYGLDLALEAGFYSPADACVPFVAPPSTAEVPKSRAINAALTPNGDPFAVGIGLSKAALDLAGWAAYNSGALCLSVGTDFVDQISTGTFGLLIPSLGDLADGDNRPMYIELRPQAPPTFAFGLGTVDGEGNIVDPLLTLQLDELDLDFYAIVADRYVRVLTLTVDVAVPLSLDVNDANEIVVLLGDLASAFSNVRPSNAELLAEEDVAQVAELLPALIGALLPALGGDLIPPIALPDIQGITIQIPSGGFTSVDDGTILAIFADLALATSASTKAEEGMTPRNLVLTPRWDASLADVLRARADGAVVSLEALLPTVDVTMDVPQADRGYYEWSYRIAGGLWSTWRGADVTEIQDSRFALDGRYPVEVRVREPGASDTVSPHLATSLLVIDRTPPSVDLVPAADGLRVDIRDLSAVDARVRVAGGPWEVLASDFVPADETQRVELEVIDDSGQTTRLVREAAASLEVEVPVSTRGDVAPAEAGCATTTPRTAPLSLVLLFGLLVLGRRRAVVAALACVMLVGCGSKDSTGEACDPACAEGEVCSEGICGPAEPVDPEPCTEDADCADGEVCDEGACVPAEGPECSEDADCAEGEVCEDGACVDPGCTEDADCAEGEVCEEGACVTPEVCDVAACECPEGDVPACVDNACACEPACGGACEDGAGCCFESQTCEPVEAECTPEDCGPGFEAAPVGDPTWDPTTCTAAIECACTELPPLPLNDFGELLDLGVSPDGTVTAVAAYNASYGDLMVGLVEGTTIAWTFVDGVPADGPILGSVAGPRGGIRANGDDIGRFPSIEVDSAGGLHVAYYQRNGDSPRSLKYAYGAPDGDGYIWSAFTVDDADETGFYTDLVLDDAGLPVIAYVTPTIADAGAYFSEIRVVTAVASPPTSAADFGTPEVMARIAIEAPCANDCASREQCRTDLNVCSRPASADDCGGGCAADASCFENEDGSFACSPFTAPSALDEVVTAAGLYLDAEWLGDGRIGAAWYNSDVGDLQYAEGAVGALADSTVLVIDGSTAAGEGRTDTSDAGWFPDFFVSSEGARWIAYSDKTFGEFRIASLDEETVVVVDNGFRCYETDPADPSRCLLPIASRVGDDGSIAELDGALWALFQDATFHEVMESPRVGATWDIGASVAGNGSPVAGGLGFYLAHGVDDEGRFALSHRFDARAETPTRDVIVIRR